ncbi:CheR family methyltransferase [Acidisoma silvae]|uniref:Chemotaxis protein methyltransferase n=1 Tax=Acidisoma silvae TaxID=2802396 RepID=A0A963YQA2_9PROT|nr:protein-glutamate O-methyltransferase [Acidisoma silvae]MCB8874939.1 protein-glutamate O-methyltransferase [Acidisoma silvae]
MESQDLVQNAEFPFKPADFRTIARLLQAEAGIALGDNKANLVYSRLAKRLRALKLRTFRDYCTLLEGPQGAAELGEMIAALTTNVTRFFREPHHFDHLRTQLMPALITAARKGQRIRFWSSACSSGQEAYSIAMTVLSVMPDAARHDVKIIATDIDPKMIACAEAGLYAEAAMDSVPALLRSRWFVIGDNGQHQVGDDLRAILSFRRLNLIGSWPLAGQFQAIFCRNVVIYFDQETQARLWERMVPALAAEGALYIGHSERITGPAASALRHDGITTYRLTAYASAPA